MSVAQPTWLLKRSDAINGWKKKNCQLLSNRFSSWFCVLGGESGSADTVRDPRGFAVKFYTEDGIWDLVGNNTPIFFIRDPILVRKWRLPL